MQDAQLQANLLAAKDEKTKGGFLVQISRRRQPV
jgi:hypothetical protein